MTLTDLIAELERLQLNRLQTGDDCHFRIEVSNMLPIILAELKAAAGLRAEVERLKRGDFTPEEFQGLCHHRDEQPNCTREDFYQGCHEYQQKLFGASSLGAADSLTAELEEERFDHHDTKEKLAAVTRERDELAKGLADVLNLEPLENGLSRRPTVCSATAAETSPPCDCYSCVSMRHHEAKQRGRELLARVQAKGETDKVWDCPNCNYFNAGPICTHCGQARVRQPAPAATHESPCPCCGQILGCYCHEHPHQDNPKCPGRNLVATVTCPDCDSYESGSVCHTCHGAKVVPQPQAAPAPGGE